MMGREIRRVPPHWDHPKNERGHLQPMHDKTFSDAANAWKEEYAKWERGEREHFDAAKHPADYQYWEWNGGPPDNREYYRPWKTEEATWFQLWETVSEGTPVSPPFATLDELAAHLAKHGDDWDRKRGNGGWGESRAKAFCAEGWAPSFMIAGGEMIEGTAIAERFPKSP